MSDLAQVLIAEEEGSSATVYEDTRGYQTIGIGCLVDPKFPGAGLCEAAIDAQFDHDSAQARKEAASIAGFGACNDVRQAVLISMCYQLGDLQNWPSFRLALSENEYNTAADAMLNSEWHLQTKRRCERAAEMMRTGAWVAFS